MNNDLKKALARRLIHDATEDIEPLDILFTVQDETEYEDDEAIMLEVRDLIRRACVRVEWDDD